jgi:hypothetical protein
MQRFRTRTELSKTVDRCLNSYVLAASAAGVGILALSHPAAEAKIIYTSAKLDCSKFCTLDINNDGRADFFLSNPGHDGTSCGYATALSVIGYAVGSRTNNKLFVSKPIMEVYASALPAGVLVPADTARFEEQGQMAYRKVHRCSNTTTYRDPWANGGKGVKNRYLGAC